MTQHVAAFVLLIGQALFLWIAGNSVWMPLVAAGLAGLAMTGLRLRLPLFVHHAMVLAMACAVALISRATFVPPDNSLAIFPPKLTHPLGDFFLLWQALLLLRQGRKAPLPAYFPCLSLVTIFCAFDQSARLEMAAFLFIAIVFLVLTVALFDRSGNNLFRAKNRERRGVGISVLLAAAVAASVGVVSWSWFSNVVRAHMPAWTAKAALINSRAKYYARSGDLGNITEEQRSSPLDIALNVVANRQPGYLRGRVFDFYAGTRWQMGTEPRRRRGRRTTREMRLVNTMEALPANLNVTHDDIAVFEIVATSKRPLQRFQILNDPRRGVVYFTPLGMNYLSGTGRQLLLDKEDVVHAGLDVADPYTAYVSSFPDPVELTERRETELLTPLQGLSPQIRDLAQQVAAGRTTFSQKIAAVQEYFQENYQYEQGAFTMPTDTDPLDHFLLNRPAAHCEYFASGAVALLRYQNIPARYVTGYVMTENEDSYEDRWVARNRDAHAWAEAYDREKKRWVIVEATPGMDDVVDLEAALEDEESVDEATGNWFAAAERGWSGLWSDYARRYYTPVGIGAIALGLVLVGVRRRQRELASYQRRTESPELIRRRKAQRRLERSLARRGLLRNNHETLHQFADRISPPGSQDPILRQAAQDCLAYAQFRYRDCR